MMTPIPRIAVLVPCYNEALTVGMVVSDFQRLLPSATIYVYDNNSTDGTREAAAASGAVVRIELLQGKGHVVRRMFRDIEADFYLLIDGDDTYDATIAAQMLHIALHGPNDLVNYVRKEAELGAYRLGHRFGNQLLTRMVG